MIKEILVNEEYLNIPVIPGKEEKKLEVFLHKDGQEKAEKIMEFQVPMDMEEVDTYQEVFCAQIPVRDFQGHTLQVKSDMPEAFAEAIKTGNDWIGNASDEKRPVIHFAADTGWTNDPNGLIYDNGIYHFYFQYNPFDTKWNNMSWGHAVSTDLLHWTQVDSVMFPDESGTIYSGCAIKNDRELLDLPKDALLFFYTAAGGNDDWSRGLEFTQKIAYSLDQGKTLKKIDEPCVPVIYRDSRDPKVYWHEPSKGYVMVLWLRANEFGVLRSEDLKNWEITDQFSLQDAWECPDLFELKTPEGESCWFFWSADGYYFEGEFDGYHFKTDGKKRRAYLNELPYAAQTYSGVNDRVISIPWLRLKNDGRSFTGTYGIPVELSCKKVNNRFIIMQKPVRELMENISSIMKDLQPDEDGVVSYHSKECSNALVVRIKVKEDLSEILSFHINGCQIQYRAEAGRFVVDDIAYHVKPNQRDLLFVVDDRILEVFFEEEGQLGTFELCSADVSLELSEDAVDSYEAFEIC